MNPETNRREFERRTGGAMSRQMDDAVTERLKAERRAPRAEDLQPVPTWLPAAAREVGAQLRAFAARYPEQFEYKDGKLQQKRSRP